MKKLLHERLREGAHEGYSTKCAIDEIIGRDCDKFEDCDECAKNALKKLADEIERYYIPRPRFEDGEPIQWRDAKDIQWKDCPDSFSSFFIDPIGMPVAVETPRLYNPEKKDGFVVRRQPKVLDADGVEIKAGDTVWHIQSGEKFTVYIVQGDGCVFSTNDMYLEPKAMTHKEPDSREKVIGDMLEMIQGWALYDPDNVSFLERKLEGYADRLSALIERGA